MRAVDISRGITKEFVITEVLEKRFSYPSMYVRPAPVNYEGPTHVYAVHLDDAVANSKNLDNVDLYTFPVGVIEQKQVPDGILNITTTNHLVYPGTIRRTVIEHDGQLFMHTSGVGYNRAQNSGTGPILGDYSRMVEFGRAGAQYLAAASNDKYGAMAFRTLDHQAVGYLNTIRSRR